jgi:hypothetical protein
MSKLTFFQSFSDFPPKNRAQFDHFSPFFKFQPSLFMHFSDAEIPIVHNGLACRSILHLYTNFEVFFRNGVRQHQSTSHCMQRMEIKNSQNFNHSIRYEYSQPSLDNPEFSKDFNLNRSVSFSIGELPKKLRLHVIIYLSPSFRDLPNGKSIAREIVKQAKQMLVDRSLDTKFELETEIVDHNQDFAPSLPDLTKFMNTIPDSNLKSIGTIHMLLTNKKKSPNVGIAWNTSVCGKTKRYASGITRWHHSNPSTAKTLAHEIGHNLGMYHDFEKFPKVRHRVDTCGPSQFDGHFTTNEIMNYGRPKAASFSKCSNDDFKQYYTDVVAGGEESQFCLTEIEGPDLSTSVDCGAHTAESCEKCPQNNGRLWCNGDCSWNDHFDKCQTYDGSGSVTTERTINQSICSCSDDDDNCWSICLAVLDEFSLLNKLFVEPVPP